MKLFFTALLFFSVLVITHGAIPDCTGATECDDCQGQDSCSCCVHVSTTFVKKDVGIYFTASTCKDASVSLVIGEDQFQLGSFSDTNNNTLCCDKPCRSSLGEYDACVKLDDLVFEQTGLNASVTLTLAGVVDEGEALKDFSFPVGKVTVGNVTGCEEIKNTTTCLAKPECGWCYETKACKTGTMVEPVCNDCNRCQWSSRQALVNTTCVQKQSCGWCQSEESCEPGDKFGPLEGNAVCAKGWMFGTPSPKPHPTKPPKPPSSPTSSSSSPTSATSTTSSSVERSRFLFEWGGLTLKHATAFILVCVATLVFVFLIGVGLGYARVNRRKQNLYEDIN